MAKSLLLSLIFTYCLHERGTSRTAVPSLCPGESRSHACCCRIILTINKSESALELTYTTTAKHDVVHQWVTDSALEAGLPEEAATAAGGKIYTSGSYRLRIHEPGSDIDAICVAPQVCVSGLGRKPLAKTVPVLCVWSLSTAVRLCVRSLRDRERCRTACFFVAHWRIGGPAD